MFAVFEQPDLKATLRASPSPRPAHWTGRLQLPDARAGTAGAATASARDLGVRADAADLLATSPPSSPGPYDVVRDEVQTPHGRRSPLGVFCRKSLTAAPRRRQHLRLHQARASRSSRTSSTCAYPFDEVRPALHARVQHGRDGERRRRDLHRGLRLPRQGHRGDRRAPRADDPARAGPHVVRRPGDDAWWDDLWLNESFAEWASTTLPGRGHPVDAAPGRRSAPPRRPGPTARTSSSSTHPIVADIRDLEDVEVNFDGITYAKGASVLKQLVAYVGREPFVAGLRAYFAKHAWGNTTLPTCSPSSRRPPAATSSTWSKLWLRDRRASTRCAPRSTVDDARRHHRRRRRCRPRPRATRRCARTASPSGCYDARRATSWCARDRLELDVDGERTEVPELVGRPAAGPAAGQRRRPGLRQDPPRRALARHGRGAPARLRRQPAARAGPRRGVGHDPRRRDARPRLRRRWCCSSLPGETDSTLLRTLLSPAAGDGRPCTSPRSTARRSPPTSSDRLRALVERRRAGQRRPAAAGHAPSPATRTRRRTRRTCAALLDGSTDARRAWPSTPRCAGRC